MKSKSIKLTLDDFFEEDFILIAIYTEEEDYRMAFLLNYFFQMHFVKTHAISDEKNKVLFSVFEYKDESHFRDWYLLQNYQLKSEVIKSGLFADMETISEKPVHYLKEFPKTKYFLKIEGEENNLFFNEFIEKLIQIPQIYTAEIVDLQRIKNMNLLKF